MANAKLDIDISAFDANVKTATGILKGLDAEMKATDATFKATGNSEKQLADKTKVLNSQIRVQKGIIDQSKQALDALSKQGVAEADAEYQKWYATLMKATAGMNNAQAELNALNSSTLEAASGADQLSTGLNGISKKISLDQVISGIGKITDGLENAAKKAIKLGEDIWNSIMDREAVRNTKAMTRFRRLVLEWNIVSSFVRTQPSTEPSRREAAISARGVARMEMRSAEPLISARAIPKETAKTTRPTASSSATTGSSSRVRGPFALYWRTTISVAAGAVAVAMAPKVIN
jgi:hypothetical protein